MPSDFHDIATSALNLDIADRLRLGTALIESVDGPNDQSWDDAWFDEVQRRRALGHSDLIPWDEARARILHRLNTL